MIEEAPAPAALTDEAREEVELLRFVLAEEGRESARELLREIVDVLTEPRPGERASHLAFLLALDRLAKDLGSLEEARRLQERVLAIRERLLPPDHPDLLLAKQNLASTRYVLGDFDGAHELFEAVFEARRRLLPPDHLDLLRAMGNVALTKGALGDLAGECELEEAVLEALTRLLPPDSFDLLDIKQNLAATRARIGDIAGAHELYTSVLEAWTRLAPPDDSYLLAAKQGLALTRRALGDLAGARELEEAVLEARTRLLPPDHPDLLWAKLNLAGTRMKLGDLAGAHEIAEAVLEAFTRLLPPDHPDLLKAMLNVAVTRKQLGDLAGARELEEAVLEARTRLLPPDYPDLLTGKLNLALTSKALGDLVGARELAEEVLETRASFLSPDHPDLLATRQNLAAIMAEAGDLVGAREHEEAVLEAWTRLLPPGHPDLLRAKGNLALTRYELGDLTGARELVSSLLSDLRVRAGVLRAEAPRPAREGARAELQRLSAALSLGASTDPEHTLERAFFATLEGLRIASVGSSEAEHALAARPELSEETRGIAGIRSRLNDLAAAGPADEDAAEGWRKELLSLSEERDRAERGLRAKLAEAGAFVGEIDADAVGARLASGEAAISYLRYARRPEEDPPTGETQSNPGSLLAFVVRPGGAVARIELGPAAELEALVGAWRAALGRPLVQRGIGVSETYDAEGDLEGLGQHLRERILDPILGSLGGVRALHVVLDDVLHLVPLDALPLEKGLVGERVAIRNEVTLARLLRDLRTVSPEGGLVIAGAIDYAAEPGPPAIARLDAVTPPAEASGARSANSSAGFAALPETTTEARVIGELFRQAFEREGRTLTGSAATKAALLEAAPKARFLHFATHGWFASEAFKSQLDMSVEPTTRDAFLRAQETLTGFAPETLCGLALAGANRGKDALGRVPGILTAEELASFDLRNCELAVLSACETNVGIRRAGQGIQSLQTALHAAGARTAITSLWKVDDAATRRLFELFYAKLWRSHLGKADALWQAKMALRAEGRPPRDWAGWILSGDPD